MAMITLERLVRRDPERRTLHALARRVARLPARHTPEVSLQVVADLARELTRARYAALAITDQDDRTEGFITSGLEPEALARLRTAPQGHGSLGSLRADGRPVRFEDVQQHAHAFGFPPHHPEMRALAGVAIWAHGEVRGALYTTDRRDGRPFDQSDERVLLTLAAHASRVVEQEWY